jgi:hypothetical protein
MAKKEGNTIFGCEEADLIAVLSTHGEQILSKQFFVLK